MKKQIAGDPVTEASILLPFGFTGEDFKITLDTRGYYVGDIQPITTLKRYSWNEHSTLSSNEWHENYRQLQQLIRAKVKFKN